MKSFSLAVVVNTYKNVPALRKVLEALACGSELPDELIIAEDGEDPDTLELVRQWEPKFNLIHCRHADKGFRCSRIMNKAIAAASSDYLVFLDGDCVPRKHFVSDHRSVAEAGTFVQGRRAFVEESAVPDFVSDKATLNQLRLRGKVSGIFKSFRLPIPLVKRDQDLKGVLGCNLGIWREDLISVNGWDEAYEGWGLEDSDVAARLYHLGCERKFVYGRATLFHLNHPTLSRESYDRNKLMLEQVLNEKRVRCEKGVSHHLGD